MRNMLCWGKGVSMAMAGALLVFLCGCIATPAFTGSSPAGVTPTTGTTITTATSAVTTTAPTTTTEPAATTTRPISYADMGKLVDSDLDVFLGGEEFHLVDDADPLLAKLGEPKKIEKPSMFGGLWVDSLEYYHYDAFAIGVAGYDDRRDVESVIIKDDSIVLNKGIRIGCTKEELRAAYGEAEYELDSNFQYAIYKDGIRYALVFYFEAVDENGQFYNVDTVQEIRFSTDYFQWKHAPEQ